SRSRMTSSFPTAGVLFSVWQTTTPALQPMHALRSTLIAQAASPLAMKRHSSRGGVCNSITFDTMNKDSTYRYFTSVPNRAHRRVGKTHAEWAGATRAKSAWWERLGL